MVPNIFVDKGKSPAPKPPFLGSIPPIQTKKSMLSKLKSYPSQMFSSYLFMPDGIRFETQEPGETIILLLRKHWFTNLSWIISSALLILIPVLLFPSLLLSGLVPANVSPSLFTFFIFGWYLITFSFLFVNFLLWYFTVAIVTQERIIDIDFINLLSKKFAETRIDRVEDVTMHTGGFIRSLFRFGDVYVQTAAKEAMFQFQEVPNPEKVVTIINELMEKASEGGGQ